ncbi:N-acetyltransferase family protein [Parapedobacter sp. DT-150]|uniref:GNAT family N-acetyltransferase n=1 Tax=Parapedobacter sp. DT-150 TaxID=3396162 RepID=UPI003F1D0249
MNEITIRAATSADVMIIHRLAHEIWWPTYGDLLAHDQIVFMLERIYAETSLRAQLEAGQRFSLAMQGVTPVGFVGFQPASGDAHIMRIEKLYILPAVQGQGVGTRLLHHVAAEASAAGRHSLELNVYRHNPAKAFYERHGFEVVATVKIPYFGYTLNDYVMQKQL